MKKITKYKGYFTLEELHTPQGKREVLHTPNAVSILIRDKTNRTLLLVRQSRPSQITEENPDGMITELIAGRIENNMTPKETIIQEVREEAGVTLFIEDITLLNNEEPLAVSAGTTTETAYLAYAEVSEERIEQQERTFGSKYEGEEITRVWIPESRIDDYTPQDLRAFALIQYFKLNRAYK